MKLASPSDESADHADELACQTEDAFARTTIALIRVMNALKSPPDALHQLGSSTVKLTKARLRVINVFTGAVAPFVNLRNALIRP